MHPVNTVCIGLVKSGQMARGRAAVGRRHYAQIGERAAGRIGRRKKRRMIAFLASEAASYVTGAASM
jgi:hypothetical protein